MGQGGERNARARRSVALVRWAGVENGVIGLADEERPESAEVIRELHAAGVDRAVMLTGDHLAAANRIGETGRD